MLAALRGDARERASTGRVFVTTSLPYLLELGNPAVSKGSGLAFVAAELGIDLERVVAFGDGENDVELLEVAGFGDRGRGRAPAAARRRRRTCPGPERRGRRGRDRGVLDSMP